MNNTDTNKIKQVTNLIVYILPFSNLYLVENKRGKLWGYKKREIDDYKKISYNHELTMEMYLGGIKNRIAFNAPDEIFILNTYELSKKNEIRKYTLYSKKMEINQLLFT
jgi:hypothetical protein